MKIVLEHPATAKRLAWRVCDELFGENVVSNDALQALADGLIENDLNMSWAFETVLNSSLFFSDANLKTRIAPPETFVLGALIALNTENNPASTLVLSNIFDSLGRSLFRPPNVGGWDGGRLWLNARTLVARSNYVHSMIRNGLNRQAQPPDFEGIVETFADKKDTDAIVTQFGELLLGLDRNSEQGKSVVVAVARDAQKQPQSERWAFVADLLLNSSYAHLC